MRNGWTLQGAGCVSMLPYCCCHCYLGKAGCYWTRSRPRNGISGRIQGEICELQVFRTSLQKLGLVSIAGKLIKISHIPVLVVKK